MSAELAHIEATLNKLDAACQAGELEEAQCLFIQIDKQLRTTLTADVLADSEQAQQSALVIFNQIQSIMSQLQQEKSAVAKELSQVIGNKKKIKAYKNI